MHQYDARLAKAFQAQVDSSPDHPALVIGDRQWTRRDIADLAERAAATLIDHGARPGASVVAQYDTSPGDLALAVAASRLGCIFVPVPTRMGSFELSYMLERARPIVFSVHRDRAPVRLDVPDDVVVLDVEDVVASTLSVLPPIEEDTGGVAVAGVTSGSTGRPKAVMHSWSSLAWTAERMAGLASTQPGEAILVTGAGAGAPGFTFFTYLGLTRGVLIVRAERWDPPRVLELMARHRCVWSTMVPTMLYMLLEAQAAAGRPWDLSATRAISIGGSTITEELVQRARSDLGVEVLRMYAMAECMAHSSMLLTDPEADRDVFDGRPGNGAELALFDDNRRRLGIGAVGEIGIKGPSLLLGYLGDPDGRSSLMTADGYFLSGDLGRLTDDGYIKVVGRKKDMIIRGGFNIDPSEVEEMLRRNPHIAQVAVVGYPDEAFGERACAVVSLREGTSMSFEDLVGYLLDLGLSKEKLPERLVRCRTFPLSPDGKILKSQLRDRISTDLDLVDL